MTFEEWWLKEKDNYTEDLTIKDKCIALAAWQAVRDQSAQIAWEHARNIRKPSYTCNRCDDIAEDIRKI